MTPGSTPCDTSDELLLDYLCGDLTNDEADRLEDHLFGCESCAEKLEGLDSLRRTVARAVSSARVGANVNQEFLERARSDGLTLREYRIDEGQTVSCFAGPEDLVVVRLAAAAEQASVVDLEVEFRDLEQDQAVPFERKALSVDRNLRELVLVFPGEEVRGYPRSRWTMRLHENAPDGPRVLGPFVMDHHPQ
jgi:hypothetical protein